MAVRSETRDGHTSVDGAHHRPNSLDRQHSQNQHEARSPEEKSVAVTGSQQLAPQRCVGYRLATAEDQDSQQERRHGQPQCKDHRDQKQSPQPRLVVPREAVTETDREEDEAGSDQSRSIVAASDENQLAANDVRVGLGAGRRLARAIRIEFVILLAVFFVASELVSVRPNPPADAGQ
jgi:hypothetical protein